MRCVFGVLAMFLVFLPLPFGDVTGIEGGIAESELSPCVEGY